MTVTDWLQQIVTAMPADGAFTITVRTAREWLDGAGATAPTAAVAVQGDFTVEEVAELMHRGASTVRGWLARGDFVGAYKLHGRDWRIPPTAVQQFQRTQQEAPAARAPVHRRRKRPETLDAWR